MWTRVTSMTKPNFRRDEEGALLVFFALCCAAIFLIAALSFDLGRRASTQTELQSFADNVSLAAAGELNGFPGAIERAERAARELIQDNYVFGTEADGDAGTTLQGESDYDIFFYAELPPDDQDPFLTALPKVAASDGLARFARVVVKDVEVEWVFANLLTIFGQTPPPDEVRAESTAGYTSLSCNVAPVFFCLPTDSSGNVLPEWSKEGIGCETCDGGLSNVGKTILLRSGQQTGGQGGFWEPGNFTWLDVRDQIPPEFWDQSGPLFNPLGPCAEFANSPNSINMYECLFATGGGTLCFAQGDLATKTGQSEGNIAAVFNTKFDLYASSSNQVDTDSRFQPAPSVIKGYVGGDGCGGGGETKTTTTMSLPADDCFFGGSGIDCLSYGGFTRYGDQDWSDGRLLYVDTNYSLDPNSQGSVDKTDVTAGGDLMRIDDRVYHVDDPFRPEATQTNSTGYFDTNGLPLFPKSADYANYPVVPGPNYSSSDPSGNNGDSSHWTYYQAEVAASMYAGGTVGTNSPKDVFNPGAGDTSYPGGLPPAAGRAELIRDIYLVPGPTYPDNSSDFTYRLSTPANAQPSWTKVFDRLGNSLPQCSTAGNPLNYSTDPRRRTLVAAAIDCKEQGVQGNTTDMSAAYYVEVFLLGPSDDVVEAGVKKKNTKKEIYVEIISPALEFGAELVEPGTFRNLVQIYR